MLVFTPDSDLDQLKHRISGLTLRLFINDAVPGEGLVKFTEANGAGYMPLTLVDSQWAISRKDKVWAANYPAQTFLFNGPLGKVYGVYLTRGSLIVAAERFSDGPYDITLLGDKIQVPVTIYGPG